MIRFFKQKPKTPKSLFPAFLIFLFVVIALFVAAILCHQAILYRVAWIVLIGFIAFSLINFPAIHHEIVLLFALWRKRPHWTHITDHLILGSLPLDSLQHLEILQEKEGVTAIVSFTEDWEFDQRLPGHRAATTKKIKEMGIKHIHLPTQDKKPLSQAVLNKSVKAIESEIDHDGIVYVHCKMGKGRSVSAVIAYLMRCEGMDLMEAIDYVKVKRKIKLTGQQKATLSKFS